MASSTKDQRFINMDKAWANFSMLQLIQNTFTGIIKSV